MKTAQPAPPRILGSAEPRTRAGAKAGDIEMAARDALLAMSSGPKAEKFEEGRATVSEFVTDAVERSHAARESQFKFSKTYMAEDRAFRLDEQPETNARGEIVKGGEYDWLKTGVSMGQFTDSVMINGPKIIRGLFPGPGSPVTLVSKHNEHETPLKKELVMLMLDDMADKMGWRSAFESSSWDLPKHGAGALRAQWIARNEIIRNSREEWAEVTAERGLKLTHWDLRNVYLSHWERQSGTEQDHVIFTSSRSLHDLVAEEAVYDMEEKVILRPDGTPVGGWIAREEGRFWNVENLILAREADRTESSSSERVSHAINNESGAWTEEATGTAPRYRILEFQGIAPVGTWLRSGAIDLSWLMAFGNDIRFRRPGNPVPEPVTKIRELARYADRMFWYITIAKVEDGSGAHDGTWHVIQFEPCPYRSQRNELFSAPWIPDRRRAIGLSNFTVAKRVVRMADQLLNNYLEVAANNADPPTGYVDMMDKDQTQKAIFENGAKIPIPAGKMDQIENALHYFFKQMPDDAFQWLQFLTGLANVKMLSNEALKGQASVTGSKSLGEVREQLEAVNAQSGSIIQRIGRDNWIAPIYQFALECIDHFLSDEEIAEYALEVGGPRAGEAREFWTTGRERNGRRILLSDEIRVKFITESLITPEVAIQFYKELLGITADMPEVDRPFLLTRIITAIGDDPRGALRSERKPVHPEKEYSNAFTRGEYAEPHETDNHLLHMQMHQMQLAQEIARRDQILALGGDTEPVDGIIGILERHLEETRILFEEQQMAMQMQAQQAMAQENAMIDAGGQPTPDGPNGQQAPGSSRHGVPPPSGDRLQNGIQAQAGGERVPPSQNIQP